MNKLDLIKFQDSGFELTVRADPFNDTVWLTQEEMSLLFNRNRTVIGRHIKNILKEECESKAVCAKFARTGSDGKTYQVDYKISD